MFKFILASLFMLTVFATTQRYTLIQSTDASGNPAWLFTEGSSGFNPTLYANVGDVLIFNVTGTSPFSIHSQVDTAGTSSSQYSGLNPITQTNGITTLTVGRDTNGILYYVSENDARAQGEIIINYNCTAIPSVSGGSAGSCIANSPNGTQCIPQCNSGFTGVVTAMCLNGTWVYGGECVSISGGSSGSGSSGNGNTNNNDYLFTIYGRSTNNCNYINDTVLQSLYNYGQTSVAATSGVSFRTALVSCGQGAVFRLVEDDNNNYGLTYFTIQVYVSGTNADSVVVNQNQFENDLANQLQQDNSVTITNIDVSSAFVMQASLFALLSVVFVALLH